MDNQSSNKHPNVFLSHASEDKERFVIDFSNKLINRGIRVWLDQRELLPGDSLIDKIFEEGLKEADAVIIVLSKNSVEKPWVKEELNAAMMKKINSNLKIIPIRLDNCPVPECLYSTVWQDIGDIQDYQNEFNRIVASIFGTIEKTELGESPKYSRAPIVVFPSLTRVDSIIFEKACEEAIERGRVDGRSDTLYHKVSEFDINREQLHESLEILEENNLIKIDRLLSGQIPFYQITSNGFQEYSRVRIPDYEKKVDSVIFHIINSDSRNSNKIAEEINIKKLLVENILVVLASRRLINIRQYLGGITIIRISTQLKRMAESK